MLVFVFGSILVLAIYLGLRARFVPSGFGAAAAERAGVLAIAHNLGTYVTAMLAPIDPVLASAWFHAPLPPVGTVMSRLSRGKGLLRECS